MKRFYGFYTLCVIALSVLLVPAAAFGETKAGGKLPANAAVVNGEPIPYAEFQHERRLYQRHLQSRGQTIQDGQFDTLVVNDMINRELIFQECAEKGIKVDPKFIQEEISAIKLNFGDPEKFDAWLVSMDMSEDKLKEQIAKRQQIRQLIDAEIAPKVTITQADAKNFYDSNPQYFQRPEEVHAQHILIKVEQNASDQQKSGAREKIAELKKRIDAGEDFNDLAKAHSECPSAQNNGDLGFFPKGRMVPAFEMAAFELKTGHVSNIVETQFGYHLIKLMDRKAAESVKFEEAQGHIQNELRNQKINVEVQKYIEKLRKTAKIETFVQ
jgi:peptidyl-prolyl cis-trans isomerase C